MNRFFIVFYDFLWFWICFNIFNWIGTESNITSNVTSDNENTENIENNFTDDELKDEMELERQTSINTEKNKNSNDAITKTNSIHSISAQMGMILKPTEIKGLRADRERDVKLFHKLSNHIYLNTTF